MTRTLSDARRRLSDSWEELAETVADGTGWRLGRSAWGLLALAFCAGLYLADRKDGRRRVGGAAASRLSRRPDA